VLHSLLLPLPRLQLLPTACLSRLPARRRLALRLLLLLQKLQRQRP
jgi:hypothetical protein